jgi:hypothetical protein
MANWSVLTGRKLKLGSYDEWRKAWQPEDMPPGVSVAEEARQARMALNIESHFANGLYEVVEVVGG